MNALTFDGTSLPLIERDGRLWLRSTDIARALGYSRVDKLARIYAMHKAEFSDSMTASFQTPISGFSGITAETRLFSLRGAHLLGMFSRTSVGSRFRRWVLDQLEAMEGHQQQNRSLISEFYQAAVELESQEKYASQCGYGLSQHKKRKPPLKLRVDSLLTRMQPSLAFF